MREKEEAGFVKWFSELSNKDINVAGGKGASLAEMYNNKFPVPPGFIVTAQAYKYFIESSGIMERMESLLGSLDVNDTDNLNKVSSEIRKLIEESELPKNLEEEIIEAYGVLDVDKHKIGGAGHGAMEILKTGHEPPFVAVRSSATTEDLADASFAGQQDSFLNVKGEKELIKKIKKCFSSLFTPRAIYYRQKKGFVHSKSYLAIVVQRMIDSEKSGVMFSVNPVKKDRSILIEAVFGLGEGIVSGRIKPDSYSVNSNLENFKIIEETVADKKVAIVRTSSGKNEIAKLTADRSRQQVLGTYEIKRLAQYAKQLEEHYGKPQDIEFAIEGNEIYIVQSRPITTKFEDKGGEISGDVLLSGLGASPGVASGVVKVIKDLKELDKIKKGDVLVTEMTNPDMVVSMQKASAIVTDEGGVTSHAAIVSREMGIPAVVGTGNATKILHDGEVITVDGNNGKIFEGRKETRAVEIKPAIKTRTKIKTIVDLPDYAQRAALSGVDGVGLVRLEGIIASSGKHPLKYVKENKIEDYVSVLVKGLKKIALPFKEIWIRSSDIRSDEFRNLQGATKEVEGNPMLGDHGIRFSLRHPEILNAELTAVKEIADEFPTKKIGFMIPQVINVQELKETKRIALEEVGIPKNVKIGIMVETPAAVQIINSLCEEGIDFISFGTNDLTQYTLAIDRNNGDVQYLYDEMNPAVLNSIRYVIRRCKHYGVETSVCGQAGSREEMAEFLIKEGIDSISVNADAVHKISELVAQIENNMLGDVKEEVIREVSTGEKVEKDEEEGEMTPIPMMQGVASVSEVQEDIEDVVLRELEGESESDIIGREERNDDYSPGVDNKNEDVPQLNDAMIVDSSDLNEKREEEINIDMTGYDKVEIKEEAKSEEEEIIKEKKDEDDLDDLEEWIPKDENEKLDIF